MKICSTKPIDAQDLINNNSFEKYCEMEQNNYTDIIFGKAELAIINFFREKHYVILQQYKSKYEKEINIKLQNYDSIVLETRGVKNEKD